MAENGRVHPNCVNASNPYHECGMSCLEKIAHGQGQKEKKKLDNHNGVSEGSIIKKKDEERKVHPSCPKAANPYHECGDHCFKRNGETNPRGVKKDSGSWSFGRKKKGSETQPNSPRISDNTPVESYHSDAQNARSEVYSKKKLESENNKSFSSSEQPFCEEIYPHDLSYNSEQVQSPQSVPTSGNAMKTDKPKDPLKENVFSPAGATPTKREKDEKLQASPEIHSKVDEVGEGIASPAIGSRNFSFLGIECAVEDSDEEEAQSVISDSCVSVGKYHVKASVSSTLQSIINRYGDIAGNCKLESNSMRAYYLECLCAVVQELQSTPLRQMTKAKVREMLAVLKDVESAQIEVNWLRNILNEISETIELMTQHQTVEAAKANCDNLLESTRKELESQLKDLALKEKELADAKARVSETQNHLSELEFESAHLEQTIQSTRSKVEKFDGKSLTEELL